MQTNEHGDVILNIGANINKAKASLNSLARDVRNAYGAFKGQSVSSPQLDKLNAQAENSVKRIEELKKKIEEMKQTPTSSTVLDNLIEKSEQLKAKISQLEEEKNAFLSNASGGGISAELSRTLDEYDKKISDIKQNIASTGKDITQGIINGDDITEETEKLKELESELKSVASEAEKVRQKYLKALESEPKYDNTALNTTKQELVEINQQIETERQNLAKAQPEAEKQPQAFARANEELRQEEIKLTGIRSKIESITSAGRNVASGVGNTFRKMSDTVSSGFKKIRLHAKTSAKSASDSFNGLNAVMKKGIRTLIKYGLGMRSFFVLFRKLRSAIVDSYKNLAEYSDEVNASLTGVKNSAAKLKNSIAVAIEPLVNTFAPMIAAVADKLSSVMSSAGSFFAALTGQKYVYKAVDVQEDYADSLADTAENAGKAQKAIEGYLSPLDDINRFTDNSDNGAAADTKSVSKIAKEAIPSQFQKMADTVKGYFTDLFKPIKTSWNKYGASALMTWHNSLITIKRTAGDILNTIKDVWTSGAGERTATNIIKLWKTVGGIIGGIVDSFRNAWNKDGLGESVIKSFTDRFNNLLEFVRGVADTFKNVWSDGAGERIWSHILSIVRNINNIIGGFWGKLKKAWDENENGKKIWGGILGIAEKVAGWFETISAMIGGFINNTDFSPILSALGTLFQCFEDLVKIIGDKFAEVFKEILLPLAKWTIEKALPTLLNLFGDALKFLGDVISNIPIELLKTLSGVIIGFWAAFKGFKLVSGIVTWFTNFGRGIGALAEAIIDNPVIAGILGLAAAVTAVVTAIEIANRQQWDRSGWKEATDELHEYTEDLIESTDRIKSAIDSVNDNIIEVKADVTQVKGLKDKLVELIKDGIISEEEMPEYKTIMDLMKGVEGFEDAWNSVTLQTIDGEIHVNTDEATKALDDWQKKWEETQYKTILTSSISELGSSLITESTKFSGAEKQAQQALSNLRTFIKDNTRKSGKEAEQFVAQYLALMDKGYNVEAGALLATTLKSEDVDAFSKLLGQYLETTDAVVEHNKTVKELQSNYDGAMSALKYLEGATTDYNGLLFLVNSHILSEDEALARVADTGITTMSQLEAAARTQVQTQTTATQSIKDSYTETETATNNAVDNMKAKLGTLPDAASKAGKGVSDGFSAKLEEMQSVFNTVASNIQRSFNNIGLGGLGKLLGNVGAGLFNIKIPMLAQGAVLPAGKPFLAMLGDQNNGRNLEAPESLIRQIVREETAKNQGGNNTYDVNVQVGRQTLFRLVLDEGEMQRKQTGHNPFNMGGSIY